MATTTDDQHRTARIRHAPLVDRRPEETIGQPTTTGSTDHQQIGTRREPEQGARRLQVTDDELLNVAGTQVRLCDATREPSDGVVARSVEL